MRPSSRMQTVYIHICTVVDFSCVGGNRIALILYIHAVTAEVIMKGVEYMHAVDTAIISKGVDQCFHLYATRQVR